MDASADCREVPEPAFYVAGTVVTTNGDTKFKRRVMRGFEEQ